jgi:hypothetical protein
MQVIDGALAKRHGSRVSVDVTTPHGSRLSATDQRLSDACTRAREATTEQYVSVGRMPQPS